MALSYLPVDRDQLFLLPPNMREWLAEDHLVWLVLELVEQLDTSGLHAQHPNDGAGRRAYDPEMLLALLLYAYCTGVRSSRTIERLCRVDVAYRIVSANQAPDHSTIARFRQLHAPLAQGLFVEVLAACAAAGLARVGVVAVDGTKMAASASLRANRSRAQLEAEVAAIFAHADAVDDDEDRRHGGRRGDELPAELADPRRRPARLRAALAQVRAQEEAARAAPPAEEEARRGKRGTPLPEGPRSHGRTGLPHGRPPRGEEVARAEEALARLERHLAGPDGPVARTEQHLARAQAALANAEETAAQASGGASARKRVAAAKASRERARRSAERRRGHAEARLAKAKARSQQAHKEEAERPAAANVTDPDSRIMKTAGGWVQGYNAQAAVNDQGVVLAGYVTQDHTDAAQCVPMMAALRENLQRAGVGADIGTVLFDAGYCSQTNLTAPGPERLIATAKSWRLRRAAIDHGFLDGEPPPGASPLEAMEHRLRTEEGAHLYGLRHQTIEPYFGQVKANRGFRGFLRRGLHAVSAEWALINASANILKLHRARTSVALAVT